MAKTRRRMRQAAVIGLEILAGATLGFLILMGVTIWRLSEGPIVIDFLSSTIEDALSDPERGMTVQIGTTQLTWDGWARGLDIHLIDVSARDRDGAVIAEVHDMTVAFSVVALSRGELSPTRLEVIAPSIQLTYRRDGSIGVGQGDAGGAGDRVAPAGPEDDRLVAIIVEELMRAPESDRHFPELRSFEVRDANIRVWDEANDVVWETPGADAIMRRHADGLNLEAAMAVRLGEDVTFFDISGYFDRAAESARLSVGFDRIDPSLLAGQSPYLRDFAEFDLPVSGQVNAVLRAQDADFDLRLDVGFADNVGSIAATGHYSLVDEIVTLDSTVSQVPLADLASRLPWLAPLTGFAVVADGQSQLVISRSGVRSAGFEFRAGAGVITLPDQFDQPLDVASISLEGAMAGGGAALDIARADIQFGSAGFVGSASAFMDETGVYEVSVDGSLFDLAIEDVGRYWPTRMAATARSWVHRRVPTGRFDRINVDLYGRLDAEAYSFDPLETAIDFAFSDVSLSYIEEMPPVEDMSGSGSYDGTAFRVEVNEGATTFDLAAGPAQVLIDGFEDGPPRVRVSGRLAGDMRNHFRLLDHAPLAFLGGYGIAPEQVRGAGEVDFTIGFDIDQTVALEAIQVAANANLRGATIPNMIGDRPLTDSTLEVTLDNNGLRASGTGVVNGTEVEFSRSEIFGGGEYAAQSSVRGVFGADALVDLGLDLERWASGPIGFSARYTEYRDETERADVALDLGAASMEIPELGWAKAPGTPASAQFSLALRNKVPFAIERFTVDAGEFAATGRVQFTADGSFLSTDLENLSLNRTQTAGRVEAASNGGFNIALVRGVVDLHPLLDREDDTELANPNRVLTISAALDRVWLTEDGYLGQVAGDTQLVGSRWFSARIDATTSGGGPIQLSLDPTENGRFLRVTSSDAGGMLADLGLTGSVRGGRLAVSARFRENEPGRPLVGDIDIADFRLVDAPILARIMGIAGITGILDALQGEGIGFGQLSTTFRRTGGLIEFREGRMVGPSLGITFVGAVDVDRDVVDLRGAVAPAFALNGILGEIPLIGDVLVGGEGEGIFALTYEASGASESPQVAVNPLSALTPGVLRNIFPGG